MARRFVVRIPNYNPGERPLLWEGTMDQRIKVDPVPHWTDDPNMAARFRSEAAARIWIWAVGGPSWATVVKLVT